MNKGQRLLHNIMIGNKLSQVELAKELGINAPQISGYMTGGTIMRQKKFRMLAEKYPEYVKNEEYTDDITNANVMKIPLVSNYIRGVSFNKHVVDSLMIYVNKEDQTGDYFVFEIKSDSMEDLSSISINDNDKVLALNIPNNNWNNLHFQKYLFIIINDGIVCTQITNINKDTGDITCHYLNPTYDDQIINFKDVKQLFYVKKVIERSISL